jgi:ketosteroid isomerase-like protein
MSQHDAETFVHALRTLENDGDVDPLVALYAQDSVSTNLAGAQMTGPEGAREFWTADRSLFQTVTSEFHNTVTEGDVTVLEWTRTGQGRGGDDVDLAGVSVLEFADGQITRFAAYIDPSALGDQSL